MKYVLLTLTVTMFFAAFACAHTEVKVEDGLVKVTTSAGDKLVHPGQKASFKTGQNPDVRIDDPIVDDAIVLYKIAKQEREDTDIKYTLTSIQSFVIENTGKARGAFATDFPNNASAASNMCLLGETLITNEKKYYSLDGMLLDYQKDEVAPYKGYYYVNFPEPVPAGESFEFVSTFEMDVRLDSLKKDDYYEFTAGDGSPHSLAFYRIVLPEGAEFLECTGNVDLLKVDSHYGRVGLTIKGHKSDSGSHYTIKFNLNDDLLAKPEDDAVDYEEVAMTYNAFEKKAKEILEESGGNTLKAYDFMKEQEYQWPKGWRQMGIQLVEAGHYEQAFECFQWITDNMNRYENPYAICAIVWQGHLLDMQGKRQQAIEKYELALATMKNYGRGPIRHDQWGIVLSRKWIQKRMTDPFTENMMGKPAGS